MKSKLFRSIPRLFWTIVLACFSTYYLFAQIPKREFRAVWVATVANIDWPSRPGLSEEEQKEEIINILDMHRTNNMNAIILQVRPMADAIYPSELEPWSHYLTGEQGTTPVGFYDPLAFWIEESHKRGMELHAWFNPYRIKQHSRIELSENHVAERFPEWTFDYGGKTYFSPAIPEVRQFVNDVVADVVSRYDIDAVHFDDYFYPYQVAGEDIPDSLHFRLYGGAFYPDDLAGWRRENVDVMIRQLNRTIKDLKPWVKFGISPFGVWRNRSEDPMGSETRAGTTNYDGLFADVVKWQREGWIDYLMPQIYWRDDHPAADFSTVAYWWNEAGYGRHVYVGLAPYRIDRKSDHRMWKRPKFLRQQVDILRQLEGIQGYGMFSSKHFFRKDLQRMNRRMQRTENAEFALIPTMPWIHADPPPIPLGLKAAGQQIIWNPAPDSMQSSDVKFYVLYRYGKKDKSTLKKAANIVSVTSVPFVKFEKEIPTGVYRVSALDRLNNESPLSEPLIIE